MPLACCRPHDDNSNNTNNNNNGNKNVIIRGGRANFREKKEPI